jgi:hypothetical protein
MQLRGRGNVVSITLAGLAVVIATTGTAVAVTATTVNIVGSNSTQVAQVAQGRLNTVGPGATINVFQSLNYGAFRALTDPTSATLAVSRVGYFNSGQNLSWGNRAVFRMDLVKIMVGTQGHCDDPGAFVERTYSTDRVPPASNVVDEYATPLLFRSVQHRLYCIGVYTVPDETVGPPTYTSPKVQLTGYVASGSYTGAGT